MAEFTPLEAPVHEPQSLPVTVPAKLIGRDILLARVYGDLKKDDAVLLHGESGVGKTALAATLASAYSELAGGVLWLSADYDTLGMLIARVARAYRRPDIANHSNPPSMAPALETLLAERKPLIVLDGAPDLEAAEEFINRCASDVPVLITSEETGEGPWTQIALDPLDADPALALFRHVSDIQNGSGTQELLNALGGLPLAIVVAASAVKANKQSPADFLAAMPKAPGITPPPGLLTLTTAFRALPNALQGLMLMLGATYRGQGSSELLSMISGAAVEGLNQAMSLLVARNLVERIQRAGQTYYRLNPLVKDFAENWLRGSQRLEGLQKKVQESIIAYASRFATQPLKLALEIDNFLVAAEVAFDQDDYEVANRLSAALMDSTAFVNDWAYGHELAILRGLSAHSDAPSAPPPLASPAATPPLSEAAPTAPAVTVLPPPVTPLVPPSLLASMAFPAHDSQPIVVPRLDEPVGDEDEFDEVIDEDFEDDDAITQELESQLGDVVHDVTLDDDDLEDDLPINRPTPPLTLSPAPVELGEMARLRAAVMQARQMNDPRGQGTALKAIAALQQKDRMDNEAIATYGEALAQFEAVNDRGEMLNVLQSLADLEFATDTLSAAALHAARGASLADQLGETQRQVQLLTLLGDVRQQMGESEDAAAAYEQAQRLLADEPDPRAEAVLLFKLGYALLDSNKAEAASKTWETALKMFKDQGRRDYEGRVLGGLGSAYGDMERWMESINFHTSAFYIAREVGDKREEALQLNNLGYASVQAKQLGQAVLRYRQALHLAYASGSRDDIISTTVDLANLLMQSPKHLTVAQLIVDEALKLDGGDRDLRRLKETIITDRADAEARGVTFVDVGSGTAREYAQNAYAMLDES